MKIMRLWNFVFLIAISFSKVMSKASHTLRRPLVSVVRLMMWKHTILTYRKDATHDVFRHCYKHVLMRTCIFGKEKSIGARRDSNLRTLQLEVPPTRLSRTSQIKKKVGITLHNLLFMKRIFNKISIKTNYIKYKN